MRQALALQRWGDVPPHRQAHPCAFLGFPLSDGPFCFSRVQVCWRGQRVTVSQVTTVSGQSLGAIVLGGWGRRAGAFCPERAGEQRNTNWRLGCCALHLEARSPAFWNIPPGRSRVCTREAGMNLPTQGPSVLCLTVSNCPRRRPSVPASGHVTQRIPSSDTSR